MTDQEIARGVALTPIAEIAEKAGIPAACLEPYGRYKAKVTLPPAQAPKGKLILVTAVNPTPYGEGKTTVAIGLADGLKQIGKNVMLALREPSLGPVFGIKGGATGGGHAQVAPMEDINLHFNGDFHAITSANNLLSSLIDNHIKHGNALDIVLETIEWRRCVDLNDRALRQIECGLGGKVNGVPRKDGFNITAASEVMAILCLANDMQDLKARLKRIVVGYNSKGEAVTAGDLQAEEAMAILLKDAIYPNLVQTLEHTPALIHGGPFANIAHGCNTVRATKLAMSLADYTVTEAGFGADLGAEKFLDIKCRAAGLIPDAVVLVATVRALKHNGGGVDGGLDALQNGLKNLVGHIQNLKGVFGVSVVCAINAFLTDTKEEMALIADACKQEGVPVHIAKCWADGGKGCEELAKAVAALADAGTQTFRFSYDLEMTAEEKIVAVATKIYGAGSVTFSDEAAAKLKQIATSSYAKLPVCIAKTQYSFSQDPKALGRPTGFQFFVRDVQLRAGAGFLVAVAGDIMLMPGLAKEPAATKMHISDTMEITGLF